MTYTPTEWKNGDIITAEGLNNIEQGIVDASDGGQKNIVSIKVTAPLTEDFYVGYCYGKPVTGKTFDISIESNMDDLTGAFSLSYADVAIKCVPLDTTNEFKTYFSISDTYIPIISNVAVTGGISSTPVVGCVSNGDGTYLSPTYNLYEVTGDCTVSLELSINENE